jgi:methyl-CpG-binding domain protein 4
LQFFFDSRHHIMAKRKRNQQAAPAKDQDHASSPSKKPKTVDDITLIPTPQEKASGKLPVASPNSKQQPSSASSKPAEPESAGAPRLGKTARKRERQRKLMREAKKSATSTDKAETQGQSAPSEQKPVPQQQKLDSVPNQLAPSAARDEKKSAQGKIRKGEKSTNNGSTSTPLKTDKRSLPSTAPPPKTEQEDLADQKSKNGHSTKEHEGERGEPNEKLSKKKLRRQKARQEKEAAASNGGHQTEPSEKPSKKKLRRQKARQEKEAAVSNGGHQKTIVPDAIISTNPNMAKSSSKSEAPAKKASTLDKSLLHAMTKTALLPRPAKQWVEQDGQQHNGSTVTNDVPAQGAISKDILGPLEKSLQDTPAKPLRRLTPPSHTPQNSASLPKDSSAGPRNELPASFAIVGVPSSNQESAAVSTPLTRPGINTIASFSLSSRRHPASVLAKNRTVSGLSGMKMDTGMIGNSSKPASGIKATSVPSYSGRGDVKDAFNRFNKFAHGGNSSDSDDDSDESDSENEAATKENTTINTAKSVIADAASAIPSNSNRESEVVASVPDNSLGTVVGTEYDLHEDLAKPDTPSQPSPVNNTVRTNGSAMNGAIPSADNSESEDEAMVDSAEGQLDETADTPVGSDNDVAEPHAGNASMPQLPSDGPRMLGEKDLPLFSDFNAKHNISDADNQLERSANFLAREYGGGPSGFGQTDDQDASMDPPPFIEYVASQDVDELYRSVEDISREVFASLREIPDCKPPSNYLDVATEPFVTDFISDHGLGRKSAELETPNKTTALNNIYRGSSPIVYIADEMDISGNNVLYDADEGLNEQEGEHAEEHDLDMRPIPVTQKAKPTQYSSSSSSLSSLSRSPTPPEDGPIIKSAEAEHDETDDDDDDDDDGLQSLSNASVQIPAETKKRKMTGTTSKHFSPRKPLTRIGSAPVKLESTDDQKVALEEIDDELEQPPPSNDLAESSKLPKPRKKGTGKTRAFFTPTSSPAKPTSSKKTTPRPPKGTSTCPVPSTNSARFGLIQEKLWDQPFWLIIAVTFLNKTTGRAAAPIFWSLKELYPTPEALSQAQEADLVDMIGTLGLQNQRAKRLILIANAWLENPPAKNQRYRTLHYPAKGDGKDIKKNEIVEEDADACEGALEIGHIPGCGPYAWDSWRIFCRDVQRGLAKDYNSRGCGKVGFVPEWQRVVPLDKELRACLRWMWLREGYVWNHETGDKRDATLQEMEAAIKGEMEIADEQERKFAAEAAGPVDKGVNVGEAGDVVKSESGDEEEKGDIKAGTSKKATRARSRKTSVARRELDVESGDELAIPAPRRSRRSKVVQRP